MGNDSAAFIISRTVCTDSMAKASHMFPLSVFMLRCDAFGCHRNTLIPILHLTDFVLCFTEASYLVCNNVQCISIIYSCQILVAFLKILDYYNVLL